MTKAETFPAQKVGGVAGKEYDAHFFAIVVALGDPY